jgi:hypothetical protein
MWMGLSLAGFPAAVALHAIFVRIIRGKVGIVMSFFCVGSFVALLIGSAALWLFGLSDETMAALLIYAAVCETYILIITFAGNSISASLMMRLGRHPASADELMKSYSNRSMVERRIEQMCVRGFLVETNGQIRLLDRGKLLARAFMITRSLFKHHPLRLDTGSG